MKNRLSVAITFILSIVIISGVFIFIIFSRENHYKALLESSQAESELFEAPKLTNPSDLNDTNIDKIIAERDKALSAAESYKKSYEDAKEKASTFEKRISDLEQKYESELGIANKLRESSYKNAYGSFESPIYAIKTGESIHISAKYNPAKYGYFGSSEEVQVLSMSTDSSGAFAFNITCATPGVFMLELSDPDYSSPITALIYVYE